MAGYLSPQSPLIAQKNSSYGSEQLDPYVAKVLAEEPVEMQRMVIGILAILNSIAKGYQCSIEFAEYARSKYLDLDEDLITMIEDILKHPPNT